MHKLKMQYLLLINFSDIIFYNFTLLENDIQLIIQHEYKNYKIPCRNNT